MTTMLKLQRRHSLECPRKDNGPDCLDCPCPLWACGTLDGTRVRISLKTRDRGRGNRRLAELEDRRFETPRKTIIAAIKAFLDHHQDKAAETKRKYIRILGFLTEFCETASLIYVDRVNVETLDRYAKWRSKERWAWIKEIELLRQFFEFCRDREWTTKNPARALKRPRLQEANHVVPYNQKEITKILFACEGIGKSKYERLRARAMTLLMRHAGLRISDVVTLSRDHIQGVYLVKQAVKNGRRIQVELQPDVLNALAAVPHPKAATADSKMFFAGEGSSTRSLVKGAWRTMAAVFARSGVEKAHPHRFRHTLASELLGKGATYEEIAAILGDSPAIVRRHYAKWTTEYQSRQDDLIRKIHVTDLAQAKEQAVKC